MEDERSSSRREEMDALLWGMSIELKALAAVGHATMQGVAAASPEAAAAIDRALERESRSARQYGLGVLIEEARRRLKAA